MTAPLPPTVVRHYRTFPGADVAICGERGSQVVFSSTLKALTCPICRAKRSTPRAVMRATAERKARAAFFRQVRTRVA